MRTAVVPMHAGKIVSRSGILPAYETEGASGLDLRAFLKEPMILKPMERAQR